MEPYIVITIEASGSTLFTLNLPLLSSIEFYKMPQTLTEFTIQLLTFTQNYSNRNNSINWTKKLRIRVFAFGSECKSCLSSQRGSRAAWTRVAASGGGAPLTASRSVVQCRVEGCGITRTELDAGDNEACAERCIGTTLLQHLGIPSFGFTSCRKNKLNASSSRHHAAISLIKNPNDFLETKNIFGLESIMIYRDTDIIGNTFILSNTLQNLLRSCAKNQSRELL